ncbi:MAG: hypothetical protein PVJ34_20135 [Anaerolineae bacterium]
MSARFHGLVSITLVAIAILVAVVTVFQVSPLLGVVYVIGCALAPLGIVYAFCAKCPCRTHCAHVLFGKLAVAFTNRRPGPYTPAEIAVVGLGLLWLLGLPQVWLWRTPLWFALFWLLNAVAVAQIRLAVCPACDNVHCPLRAGS